MKTGKKSKFRAWYITLVIALAATAVFVYFVLQTLPTMEAQDDPFAALGILMVYANYFGIALLVAIIAWILTIILAVKKL